MYRREGLKECLIPGTVPGCGYQRKPGRTTWSQTIWGRVLKVRDSESWSWQRPVWHRGDVLSCLILPPHPQTLLDVCAQKPCPQNSHCLQTGPSFQCLCLQGWTGSLCNIPLSSCQKAALSQGTSPRPIRGKVKREWVPSSIPSIRASTQRLGKTADRVQATQTNHRD